VKRKNICVAVSVVVVLGFLIGGFGCAQPAPGPAPTKTVTKTAEKIVTVTPTPTPTTVLKEGVIKFGVVTPLSGPAAPWGVPHMRATEMVFDNANAAGGVVIGDTHYTFQAVGYDSKLDPSEVVTVVNKLVFNDQVKYITILNDISPGRDVLRDNDVLNLNIGWEYWQVNPDYPLMFAAILSPEEVCTALYAKLLEAFPDAKRRVAVQVTSLSGTYCEAIGLHTAEAAGLQQIATEWYEPGTTEFNTITMKAIGMEPDLLEITSGSPGDQIRIVKAAREAGYTGPIYAYGSSGPAQLLIDFVGKEYAAGKIDWAIPLGEYTAEMKSWAEQYIKKYGGPFDPTTIGWDNMAQVLVDGIRAAKSLDSYEIADALRSPGFKGHVLSGDYYLGGKEIYGIANQVCYPAWLQQIQPDGTSTLFTKTLPDEYLPLAVKYEAREKALPEFAHRR